MSRNRERQQELQLGRVDYARTRLEALGYPVTEVNATTLQFIFRGSPVTLYPYSGFANISVAWLNRLPWSPLPIKSKRPK